MPDQQPPSPNAVTCALHERRLRELEEAVQTIKETVQTFADAQDGLRLELRELSARLGTLSKVGTAIATALAAPAFAAIVWLVKVGFVELVQRAHNNALR